VPNDRREAYYRDRLYKFGPRYPHFDLASAEISLDLLYTYDLLHQQMNRLMSPYGLSKSTLNILMLLRHGPPEGMQLHDLGELLLVSRANVTGLIDHLEERGYVKRVVDVQDRRARYAQITQSAEALLDEFMPVHYGNINKLLQDLNDADKQTLVGLLKKVRMSLLAHSENFGKVSSGAHASLAN
jgi:MarR family transcriptional regulator, 2-MHQ and catechol-resistance regulon repressor